MTLIKPNIKLLHESANMTILQDNIGLVWLYSDKKPIAYYDFKIGKIFKDKELNNRQNVHCGVFKKKIKNNELVLDK